MITNDIIFVLPKLTFRIVICLHVTVLLMLCAGEGPYWPQGLFLSGAGEGPYHHYRRLLTSLKTIQFKKVEMWPLSSLRLWFWNHRHRTGKMLTRRRHSFCGSSDSYAFWEDNSLSLPAVSSVLASQP